MSQRKALPDSACGAGGTAYYETMSPPKENAMWPTMTLEEFLANPLAAIREIAASEKVFILTENGEPILDMRPWRSVPIEELRGSVIYCGDVVTPVEDPFR